MGGETDYEALRAQALGTARSNGTCAGLFVLLRQGVGAWIKHRSPGPEPPPPAASPLVDHRHAALVLVLASMALTAGTEAHI